MVFSSIPAYLDPSNWQHQQQNNQIIGSSGGNPLFLPQTQPVPPPALPHGGGGAGSIRPGSMAERARLANVPLPETALKCPRCDSSNTKFCYFNNYSLSQPRHFCKTCRRYWTRGGALRNVPVGGGCRRNKRSSKSAARSKSPGSGDSRQQTNPSSTTPSSTNGATTAAASNMLGLTPQLRFMANLSQITDNFSADLINYNGITTPPSEMMNFHGSSNLFGGSAPNAGVASLLSGIGSSGGGGIIEPWRSHHQLQQFPFFGGLDPSPSGIFQFQGSGEPGFMGGGESSHAVQERPKLSNSALMVKMEENPDQANLSRQLLSGHDHHQWNTASTANWPELSSFSTSSTRNQL